VSAGSKFTRTRASARSSSWFDPPNGNFAKAAILLWPRIERLLELGKRGAA